jgi:hypothetical protein
MPINFSSLEDKKTVLIEADGDVTAAEVTDMRRHSVELVDETGFTNFIVDLRDLQSLEQGHTFAIFDLGERFSEAQFSVWANTAVLMPDNPAAREQVEFLHTVEINRGRGVINYVETFDEAFSWFEEMAGRA